MAIALATSPATVTIPGGTPTGTTSSFTAPASSLLVACVGAEFANGSDITNNGAALTWTQRRVINADTEGTNGLAAIYTAPVSASRSLTVTSRPTGPVVSATGGLKVFVFTGVDLVNPVGNSSIGTSGTRSITPTIYTSSVDGSRGVGVGNDWNARGTPVSTDEEYPWWVSGTSSDAGIAVHKLANTATAGTPVTMNFNAAGASPLWNWCAIELRPASLVTPFIGWGIPPY